MAYSRLVSHLLPAPYVTNCFDYTKIGFRSRSDCIDKLLNLQKLVSLEKCKYLPMYVNMDKSNDRDKYWTNESCKIGTSICKRSTSLVIVLMNIIQ